MNQDRDLVEEERQAARLAASADDRTRPSNTRPSNTRPGMDAGTRKLAIVAGGLGGLLVLMVGGWSLLGHRPSGVPILSPPPGPIRIKPADPGGMQLMGTQVAQTNDAGPEALAPGPEQAAPQALQAEVDKARQADRPATPPVTPPAPLPAAKPSAASVVVAPVPAAVEQTPAASSTPAPLATSKAVAPPVAADAPEPAGEPAPEPVGEPGPARTASAPADQDAAPSPSTTGHRAVQLAALDSDAAAHAEWARLSHRLPSLFAGRTPVVAATTHDGKQFFRLRTGGFNNVAEATAFCARARSAGIACTLADF